MKPGKAKRVTISCLKSKRKVVIAQTGQDRLEAFIDPIGDAPVFFHLHRGRVRGKLEGPDVIKCWIKNFIPPDMRGELETIVQRLDSKAPPATTDESDGWQQLIGGKGDIEESLWASPDGRLYLWDGRVDKVVKREVDFEQARNWFDKFHADAPYILPPHFPEASAGERFTTYAFRAVREHKVASPQNAQSVDNEQWKRLNELEHSINQAFALIRLLERLALHPDGAGGYRGAMQCGLVELGSATYDRLMGARNSLSAAEKAVAR